MGDGMRRAFAATKATRKKAQGLTDGTLSPQNVQLLQVLVDGGRLLATRNFPQPHRYNLHGPKDADGHITRDDIVDEKRVLVLVNGGYVSPKPVKPDTWDEIEYHLTEKGRVAGYGGTAKL
jgi:hypothetical protein